MLEASFAELNSILSSGECYCLKMLAVNGSDLIHIGYTSGAQIGNMLAELLDRVILGELPNEKEALVPIAKSEFDKSQ